MKRSTVFYGDGKGETPMTATFLKVNKMYSYLSKGEEGENTEGKQKEGEEEEEQPPEEDDMSAGFKTVGVKHIVDNAHQFFSMCICGPSLSGKTTLLMHMLSAFTKSKRYDKYIIMSPTAKATKIFDKYLRDKKNIISEYDEDFIQSMLDSQGAKEAEDRDKLCFVFDDTIGSAQKMQRSKVFADLWALARNMNISVILLSQAVSRAFLPKIARCNCHYLACCGLRGKSCMDTLKSDYLDGWADGKKGLLLYKAITKGKYNFALFCLRENTEGELPEWVMRIKVPEKVPAFTMDNNYRNSGVSGGKGDKSGKRTSSSSSGFGGGRASGESNKDTTVDDVSKRRKRLYKTGFI